MHRVFGDQENVSYIDRQGAYLIPIKNDSIAVVQIGKGYFHPIQTYYIGELLEKVQVPTESDHKLMWLIFIILRAKTGQCFNLLERVQKRLFS